MQETQRSPREESHPKRTLRRSLLKDVWFWTALILGIAFCWVLSLLMGWTIDGESLWTRWRLLLWLVVLYPVVEEWIFRGVLQPWLLNKRFGRFTCCGISAANAVTSLLFASAHLFVHDPVWAGLVIVPSLIYGWFRDRYESIFPGTVLHSSYNLGYFAFFGLPLEVVV